MPYGLLASLILHAALLAWAVLYAGERPLPTIEQPPVAEISILADDGVTRQKQGEETAKTPEAAGKEGEAKEAPKKPEAKTPTPTPPAAAAATPEPPKPEPPKPDPIAEKLAKADPPPTPKAPSPDDQKLLDEKLTQDADLAAQAKAAAEAKAKAEEKAKAEAERKKKLEERRKKLAEQKKLAEKKKAEAKKSLSDMVASALDKVPDASGPPKALLDKQKPKPANVAGAANPAAATGPAAGTKTGTDTQLTAGKLSLLSGLMRSNVQRCWNINSGVEGAGKLVVTMEFKLSRDGRLMGDPRVVNPGSGPLFDDAVNSAKRALVNCQPYTNLPPELYTGGWEWMQLPFDPSKMF